MIIEGAFYKLPELMFDLNNKFITERTLEATLVNFFTNAMMLEFNARNIQDPMRRILVEKKYPSKKSVADIYVDLTGLYHNIDRDNYGIYNDNFFEVKCFTKPASKKKSDEPTTENVAKIINDMIRLLIYGGRNCGKYLLIFFDNEKQYYLAYKEREYLNQLFSPGKHDLHVNWKDEVKTFKAVIHEDFNKFDIKVPIYVYESRTLNDERHSGYLIKILK